MADTAAPSGTPVVSKPAVAPPVAAGAPTPITTAKAPVAPVHPGTPVAETAASQTRVEAARAKLAGPETPNTPVVKDGERPREAAPVATPAPAAAAPAELDVAAAVEKAKAVEAAKAAAVLPADVEVADKAKRARALADKGDHLGAIRELGIDLDAAVKQKVAAPAEDDPKAKELATLKAENDRLKAESDARKAADTAREQGLQLVNRVIADPDFANLTQPAQVAAAFDEARGMAKTIAAAEGRPLTEAESDRLVRHILGQHNLRAAGNPADKSRATPPTIPAARAAAAPGNKPKYRTAEEVRRTNFQPTPRN